jgi:protein TonB
MLTLMLTLAAAPALAAPAVVEPARARASLVGLLSDADYPVSALANREEGIVEFRLDVGANGRVEGCAITRSSGSSALDSTTCRLLRSRARFTPARDSTGMPRADTVAGKIGWTLPPPTPPAAD